jgi:hypothetical protein
MLGGNDACSARYFACAVIDRVSQSVISPMEINESYAVRQTAVCYQQQSTQSKSNEHEHTGPRNRATRATHQRACNVVHLTSIQLHEHVHVHLGEVNCVTPASPAACPHLESDNQHPEQSPARLVDNAAP